MAKYAYDYPRPCVTADVVVLTVRDGDLKVLLIRRKSPPFQGQWAIPGGFVEMAESLEAAARRELEEETGVTDVSPEQLRAFGDPHRDPRTRVITVAFLALVPWGRVHVRAGDDAAEARWHSMFRLPRLAFDHEEVLACALGRLRDGLDRRAARLLPEAFTLDELRAIHEVILRKRLNVRSFRRRVASAKVLRPLGEYRRAARGGRARLYALRVCE